ncbi:MAG: TraR/DksA C4-type zinc finger protein [Lewinella sp.]|nr:TraR/DksA C4-type zinc finger protein [Lewinella sp.]
MQANAPKSRYSDEELEEFRILIEGKLENARRELTFYKDQLKEIAENPDSKVKSLDDGVSSMESERLFELAGRQEKLIKHLENALIRIKNKVYGVCRESGRLISKERLRAVPHATLSIDAKKSRRR